MGSEIQVVDLAADAIELDADQGDLGDFLPEGEFTQEVCFYEWTWTEDTARPLVRFWW